MNDPVLTADDPQLDAAMAQLESDMAADATSTQAALATTTDSAIPAQQSAPVQAKKEGVEPPKADASPGAPATAEPKTTDSKPTDTKQQSEYAKTKARKDDSWKALNTEKDEVHALRKQLEEQSSQLKRDREALEAEKAKVAQPKHKPEEYESYAQQCEKQAADLEAAGKFDEAAIAKYKATKAKEYADELRKNPPPAPKTDEQAIAEKQKLEKEWYGKGGIDYPLAAKQGTPENNALLELLKVEPGLLQDPKAMYYGLRLVTAETAAARVPSLDKDLSDARAKIKELQEKLEVTGGAAPPGSMAPVPFEQQSGDEQWAALERDARALG